MYRPDLLTRLNKSLFPFSNAKLIEIVRFSSEACNKTDLAVQMARTQVDES